MIKQILIVEDNLIASKVQKMIVESFGFAVDCAMTGEEGVELAHKKVCLNPYGFRITRN
ncbi:MULTISPECIES: response regulator [Legionella]|uniref:Response regulatory domain-containing protein n=1 Tax=Legionella drozanskii LLAP-1 TaxID=1212489 RepID=A0A0W0SLG5_9GAMM|nr:MULTISPECIES: response regulator [Legionella]KTC84250.1 hypothetical protein Ldro_3056 [Legionella drozanskii LLAP-1]